MDYFVAKDSVVREVWGKSDTILFIFAGAAAEFALNKAVDWLYFTGKLPADPLGRLFSTVSYARLIIFSDKETAHRSIDSIAAIHAAVEAKRGAKIPEWAYRDVLFLLIDYSIRSFEILERQLHQAEKQEVFDVFYRVGNRMGISGLPATFDEWKKMRKKHLNENMQHSIYTDDLFCQYRKHLGVLRFKILLEAQSLIVPPKVKALLGFRRASLLAPLIGLYKLCRIFKFDHVLKCLIQPADYKEKIKALDTMSEIPKTRRCPFHFRQKDNLKNSSIA